MTSSAPSSAPLLIVNGDDFGLTAGVCTGILRAAEVGILTSTSVLTVGPAWPAFSAALESSGLGVGMHSCLVGEDPPLLSATEIPSLVGADGRFPLTWREFIRRSATGLVDSDDLQRELSAQLEALQQSNVRITHIDSHQNLHHWPQVSSIIVELAGAAGIGAARVTRSNGWSPGAIGIRVLGASFARRCSAAGLSVPDGSTGLDEAGNLSLDRLTGAVRRLAAADHRSAEIGCHPGIADDPERERYRWDFHWGDELAALCDPLARSAVERAGWVLGDFGDLRRRTEAAGAAA